MVDRIQWAYPEDVPNSRCTPEDGPWPRAFCLLDDAEIWEEFQRLADPSTVVFSSEKGWQADAVNFQPSPAAITQDRYVLRQLNVHGRLWTLTGVFDGECLCSRVLRSYPDFQVILATRQLNTQHIIYR
jgi:pyruvate dehydrogenase phosphatase